ncbi:MAG: prepilin-type N-terminal cleavage/methylation domain-containing protein [Defluviitaleaceae bacterium]|nr:prepilin-type N-terminal cleavage/methylation domain-containing protein [Defluviitaleaceae bacterium]
MLKRLFFPKTTEKKKNKGFTLVELIIVIVLLVVLAGIAAFAITQWIGRGSEAAAHSEAEIALRAVVAESAFRHARSEAGLSTVAPFANVHADVQTWLVGDGMDNWSGTVTAVSVVNGIVQAFTATVNGFNFTLNTNGRLDLVTGP